MTVHEQLIYGFLVLGVMLFLFSKISAKAPLPLKPDPPEPLTVQPVQQQVNPANIQASFDSSSLQAARGIVYELEKHHDPQTKMMLLADYLHKTEQYRQRQTGRQQTAQQRDIDVLEMALALANRINGQNAVAPMGQIPTPPPQFRPNPQWMNPNTAPPHISGYPGQLPGHHQTD